MLLSYTESIFALFTHTNYLSTCSKVLYEHYVVMPQILLLRGDAFLVVLPFILVV